MKKVERDLVIDEKLKDLNKRKEDLSKELNSIDKGFKTNLRLKFPNEESTVIIRVIQDKKKLIMIIGKLMTLKNTWELGVKEVYGEDKVTDFPYEIESYTIDDWITDIKSIIRRLDIVDEIEKISKAEIDLPKFYTEDKKDDIDFENLMKSLE